MHKYGAVLLIKLLAYLRIQESIRFFIKLYRSSLILIIIRMQSPRYHSHFIYVHHGDYIIIERSCGAVYLCHRSITLTAN